MTSHVLSPSPGMCSSSSTSDPSRSSLSPSLSSHANLHGSLFCFWVQVLLNSLYHSFGIWCVTLNCNTNNPNSNLKKRINNYVSPFISPQKLSIPIFLGFYGGLITEAQLIIDTGNWTQTPVPLSFRRGLRSEVEISNTLVTWLAPLATRPPSVEFPKSHFSNKVRCVWRGLVRNNKTPLSLSLLQKFQGF